MDLLKELERVDQNRARLQIYIRRIEKARWLFPGTVKELVRAYEERFEEVTRERRRVLELIHANPIERERFRSREKALLDKAAEMMIPKPPLPPGTTKAFKASDAVYAVGKRVVDVEREEAKCERHLKEAQHYYITGAWQQHRIPVAKVTELMDDITLQRDIARMQRGRIFDGLYQRVGMELRPGQGSVSLQIDHLLQGIRVAFPGPEHKEEEPTPLRIFLQKNLEEIRRGDEQQRRARVPEPQR